MTLQFFDKWLHFDLSNKYFNKSFHKFMAYSDLLLLMKTCWSQYLELKNK